MNLNSHNKQALNFLKNFEQRTSTPLSLDPGSVPSGPKSSYSPTKMMQALFMDLIISAFVLESKQWQPRIQELLK